MRLHQMLSKTQAQTSWVEYIKSTFDLEKFIKSLDLSFNGVMNLAVYLCAGFFFGFFFKKCMRYLFLSIILTAVVLYALNTFQIISIDIIKFKALIGMKQADTFQSMADMYLDWMKNNIPIVLSASIGFLIGYKVG